MKQIPISLNDLYSRKLPLGRVGENEHVQFVIDCSSIFGDYADAVPTMIVSAPGGECYSPVITKSSSNVLWTITDSDVAREGGGELQLTFTDGTEVIKSYVGKTVTYRSLAANGQIPTPIETWMEQASDKLIAVDNALEGLSDIDATASGLSAGSSPTVSVTTVSGHKRLEFGIPAGAAGTTDYSDLSNKPQIAGTTLSGNKSLSDLGIAPASSIIQLDSTLASSTAAAPADKVGALKDDVDDILDHETYNTEAVTEYNPVTENSHVDSAFIMINGYGTAAISTPTDATVRIYPVTVGKTYKVIGRCKNSTDRPLLIVADSVVSNGTIALQNAYDYAVGTHESATVEEKEYTALRTGYMYITASDATCGVWEKVVTPAERKYHINDVMNDISNVKEIAGIVNRIDNKVFRTKVDSASALIKIVPRNAESVAKVTSLANSVTLVRSILSRNVANKNAIEDVEISSDHTTKKGIKTVWLPSGRYWVSLGAVGPYTMVKYFEKGIYSATLYKDQFPMQVGITDPGGGYFVVYAGTVSQLGDVSSLFIGKMHDGETTINYEAYSEKTYTPEAIEADNRIDVVPEGIIEFVNSGNAAVASTVEYAVYGKDDKTTTRKDFITSPDGSKFLPIVKNDGSVVAARVVPKKALFIGNSLTSGWQTFGESASEYDKDFVGRFSAVIADLDSSYTFNRKWSTQFEQKTSLADAQSWVTTNIDPLLSSDLDLIVVQLSENVVGNASAIATFPSSSLWLLQHLRETCPKARVVWMGVWLNRTWSKTLLDNTAKTGCEYVDISPLYLPENISTLGSIYEMESDYAKTYTVDSFTVDNGQITLVFTVDEVQYTAVIPSYTSYTSSSDTSITVTGVYHVVCTYYEAIHPGDEGFRKIANKLLFDLGISDSEETIPAGGAT